ncbi:hypothetical protein NVP1244A_114 [Vibrio phage 1.244.A._10N.261.54.C3]|nr:hypothetical protein NVP1244A_114 [Vibrio phage 1.244.A._10N.261.54.C3]AUR98742.1 hypothetical protein NVP1255O_114 [Vibrio phage 1.255.O._10N.286.45.F1]
MSTKFLIKITNGPARGTYFAEAHTGVTAQRSEAGIFTWGTLSEYVRDVLKDNKDAYRLVILPEKRDV